MSSRCCHCSPMSLRIPVTFSCLPAPHVLSLSITSGSWNHSLFMLGEPQVPGNLCPQEQHLAKEWQGQGYNKYSRSLACDEDNSKICCLQISPADWAEVLLCGTLHAITHLLMYFLGTLPKRSVSKESSFQDLFMRSVIDSSGMASSDLHLLVLLPSYNPFLWVWLASKFKADWCHFCD